MVHTFVINLDRDTERMDALHKHLVECGLGDDYERIPASTGYEPDMPEWMEHACPDNVNGCFASHRRCWKEMIQRNIDWALILEDDVRFTDEAPMVLEKALKNLPSDFDILYLGCFGECGTEMKWYSPWALLHNVIGFRKVSSKLPENAEGLTIPTVPFGFHAYIITRRCAEQLLELGTNPGSCHVDLFTAYVDNLAVYACEPTIAYQDRKTHRSHNVVDFPRIINSIIGTKFRDNFNIKNFTILGTFPITNMVIILGILVRFFPWLLVVLIPDLAEDFQMVMAVIFVALITSLVTEA